ncbi:unnamed protein product [Allacma fusca]|uniref:Uncharacterized protein n=1 Tax=Allacma fusca TaxID=39272 RepID=A0A8J2KUC6_9HEXA|nr:unnamed protein product [Allacma fusca]
MYTHQCRPDTNNTPEAGEIFPDSKRLERLKIRNNLCLHSPHQKMSPHYYQGHVDRRLHASDNKCNLNPRPMTQANFQSSKFNASPKSGKQRQENNGMLRDGALQHPLGGRDASSIDKIFEERRPDNLLSDERFCTFKQSKVPKECSLSSFLQTDNQHDKERFWPASITSYKTDPIGKPFGSQYRLDGLLLEDFKFKRSQHFEIPKYIRHGSQVAGNEASKMRSRKAGVRPSADQFIGVGVNQRRF